MLQLFLKRKRFFFFIFLIILCLSLIAREVEKKKQYNAADKVLLAFFTYPLTFTTLCIKETTRLWEHYFFLINLKSQNEQLQKQLDTLTLENQQLREQAIENERLKKLLAFKKKFSYHMLPAEIIGRDPSSWFKSIMINKGTSDGVQRGCGVITPQGVVGQVIETTYNSSKILLITDVNSTVDVVLKRSRARGILEGFKENTCTLNYVVKTEDINKQDVLLTSGLNAIFPKGVIIGSVIKTEKDPAGFFQMIEVKPAVDFSKLTEVLIVLRKREEPDITVSAQ